MVNNFSFAKAQALSGQLPSRCSTPRIHWKNGIYKNTLKKMVNYLNFAKARALSGQLPSTLLPANEKPNSSCLATTSLPTGDILMIYDYALRYFLGHNCRKLEWIC